VSYVDDCLIIGPGISKIQALKRQIHKAYAIEDRGPASFFLGVRIIRDRPNRTLWLSQSQYIEEAIRTFNLEGSRPISVPLQPNLVNLGPIEGPILDRIRHKRFQAIVGTAMYLVTQTRPDISFPVQWLARAFQASKSQHLVAVQNLFRYLNSYRHLAIRYSARGLKDPL